MALAEGEDYEIAMSVVNHLRQTEAGRLWLAQANVVAQRIQGRIGQRQVGGVESAENGKSEGSGIDRGEDIDDPLRI